MNSNLVYCTRFIDTSYWCVKSTKENLISKYKAKKISKFSKGDFAFLFLLLFLRCKTRGLDRPSCFWWNSCIDERKKKSMRITYIYLFSKCSLFKYVSISSKAYLYKLFFLSFSIYEGFKYITNKSSSKCVHFYIYIH